MKPSTRLSALKHDIASLRGLPIALRISCGFYLLHILIQGKTSALQLSAFLTILFLGWSLARREIRPSFHVLYFPLALYGIASTTSALANRISIHAYADAMIWFKMLIFPAAIIIFRTAPRVRDLALRAHILFAVFIALYGLYQYFVLGRQDLDHRISGPSTHVMTYSGLLLAESLLLLFVAIHRRSPWLIGATVVVSFALLLTFTRSVWQGWIAGLFVVLLLNRSRWLPYAIAALLLFVALMPMNLFGRLVSSFDVRQSSNLDRIRMAEAGIEMIKDHPVLGVGPAGVKDVYPLYRKEDAPRFRVPHLHNNVIQIWAERGIVGLAAYILLMVLFLRECARAWNGPGKPFAEAGIAITVGLAYAGLFEFNFGDTEVFYLTLELFALLTALMERPAEAASNEVGARFVPHPVPA